jgi:hypothetical protein
MSHAEYGRGIFGLESKGLALALLLLQQSFFSDASMMMTAVAERIMLVLR